MKKLLLSLIVASSLSTLFAQDKTITFNQMQWLDDLEVLVKLNTQDQNSIAGRDINENGVRDDVEAYIHQKFQDAPFDAKMFFKAAQKIQHILTLPKDASVEEHLKLDKELLSIYTCRDYILYRNHEKEIDQQMLKKTLFKGKVLNTPDRLRRYIEHKKKLPLNFSELTKEQLESDKKSCLQTYYSFQKETQEQKAALSSLPTKGN